MKLEDYKKAHAIVGKLAKIEDSQLKLEGVLSGAFEEESYSIFVSTSCDGEQSIDLSDVLGRSTLLSMITNKLEDKRTDLLKELESI